MNDEVKGARVGNAQVERAARVALRRGHDSRSQPLCRLWQQVQLAYHTHPNASLPHQTALLIYKR